MPLLDSFSKDCFQNQKAADNEKSPASFLITVIFQIDLADKSIRDRQIGRSAELDAGKSLTAAL